MHFSLIDTNFPDMLDFLRLFLEAGGHSAEIVKKPPDHGQSVFIERFRPKDVEVLRELAIAERPAVIVATEFVTGQTFNDFVRDGAAGEHYSDLDLWQWRYNGFRDSVPYARAIWVTCEAPEQLALYREIAGGTPVVLLPFPHLPNYKRIEHRADKDLDILFWGSGSPYRESVLGKLLPGRRLFWGIDLPDAVRDDYTSRAKVALALRLAPYWPYPSSLRIWYHLEHGSAIVADKCPWTCASDRYVKLTPADELGQACDELLADGAWERFGKDAHDRFEAECPGAPAVERLLDLAFSSTRI